MDGEWNNLGGGNPGGNPGGDPGGGILGGNLGGGNLGGGHPGGPPPLTMVYELIQSLQQNQGELTESISQLKKSNNNSTVEGT